MEKAPRKPRCDSKYNAEEYEQIRPFKESYIKATTRSARILIFRSDILPAMFNFWKKNGKNARDQAEGKRWTVELTDWCSNNWRMERGVARKSNNFRPKRAEVLWNTNNQLVMDEIAKLLYVEHATTETPGWFSVRSKATKNVIQNMSPEELEELDEEVEKIATKGYNEKTQRRLALKYSDKRVSQAMEDNQKEMGMSSIVFTCYTRPDGLLAVDVHDRIAELMGIESTSFVDTYPDEVNCMRVSILNYIKGLRNIQSFGNMPSGIGVGSSIRNKKTSVVLIKTIDGYPIIPPLESEKWTKKEWESLFTTYMGDHYKLATDGKSVHLPYADIATNQNTYIDKKYLPKNFKIKDARNLQKHVIRDLFEYLTQRQEKYGAGDTFRFKSIKSGNDIIPAKYPERIGTSRKGGRIRKSQANVDPNPDHNSKVASHRQTNTFITGDSMHDDPDLNTNGIDVPEHDDPDIITNAIDNGQQSMQPYTIVGDDEMRRLHRSGLPMPLALNGPNEGVPRYAVPTNIYSAFNSDFIDPTLLSSDPSTSVIPTQAPTPTPSPLKRSVRIDQQNVQKGKSRNKKTTRG